MDILHFELLLCYGRKKSRWLFDLGSSSLTVEVAIFPHHMYVNNIYMYFSSTVAEILTNLYNSNSRLITVYKQTLGLNTTLNSKATNEIYLIWNNQSK